MGKSSPTSGDPEDEKEEQTCPASAGCPIPVPPASTSPSTAGSDRQGPQGHAQPHRRRARSTVAQRGRHAAGHPPGRRARSSRSLHGLTRTLIANMVIGVTDGLREEARDRRHRLPRASPRARDLEFALGFSHPVTVDAAGRHHLPRRGAHPVQRVRASTSSRSARSPRTSASSASPTRTRARACGTPASRSGARSERRVSRRWRSRSSAAAAMRQDTDAARQRRHLRVRKKVAGTAAAPAPRGHPVLPAHRRRRSSTTPAAARWPRPPRWRPTCAALDGDKTAKARKVGELVAERAKAAGVDGGGVRPRRQQLPRPGRGGRRRRPRGRPGAVTRRTTGRDEPARERNV